MGDPLPLREYVFKTASADNLLCRWTQEDPTRWILIQMLRARSAGKAEGAIFTLHAKPEEIERFLRDDFGKKYGTFNQLYQHGDLASVEVTNYLLPAYRGADPIELTTRLLGSDAFFAPILVHEGYIHVRVIATPPADGKRFAELITRITAATHPEDFRLIHSGSWNPLGRLKHHDDRLTQRQVEVLKLAIEFGYYDNPRRCTLEEIARAFGVSKAAVHKHLVAAESKIIKAFQP